ncbi:MAG TPA: hypothetical protein VMW24_05195 [Sedimentisphaerales bacterium]|nr:hypothetical protein [Sedimentisphaerales bacterium]
MIDVKSVQDVYPAIEELIPVLEQLGYRDVSCKLDHRIHKVCWTSATELFEELGKLLRGVNSSKLDIGPDLQKNLERLLAVIEQHLRNGPANSE